MIFLILAGAPPSSSSPMFQSNPAPGEYCQTVTRTDLYSFNSTRSNYELFAAPLVKSGNDVNAVLNPFN